MKRGQTEKKTLSRKVDQTFTEHLKESRRVQEQKVRPDLNCPSQADGRGRTGRHVCDGRTGERKETETRGRRRVLLVCDEDSLIIRIIKNLQTS